MDGYNVTWSQLKNLITDAPAPITLPLNSKAQLSRDFTELWDSLGNDLCVEVNRKKTKERRMGYFGRKRDILHSL